MSATALVPILALIAVLAIALWVYADAKRFAEEGRPVIASFGRLEVDTPTAWFVGCVILWIVFVPLYLVARDQAR